MHTQNHTYAKFLDIKCTKSILDRQCKVEVFFLTTERYDFYSKSSRMMGRVTINNSLLLSNEAFPALSLTAIGR
jgi:hypothetical protein